MTLTVTPVNDAPVAVDDTATTPEDTSVAVDVLTNDTDPDPDVLIIQSVADATNGTAVVGSGVVTFTPSADYNGPASFTYTASDQAGGTSTATVSITVTPVNDAPVAANDSYTTNEDAPFSIPAPGILANDTDVEGDPLTASTLDGPFHSSPFFFISNGAFSYFPDANFNGTDSFTYRAFDGTAFSNTATVTITVNAVNDAPIAGDDSYSTPQDTPLNENVLDNDTDVDAGASLTAAKVTDPSNGTVTVIPNGTFTYMPNPGYIGPDSFTYAASDGLASDVATVSISVVGESDLSITKTDGATADVPGTSITYTIVVTNPGPSTAADARVSDLFPAALTGVTWTSVGSAGVTGNSAGSGNIDDTVDHMPVGATITYTVNAMIDPSATGTLANTASVTAGPFTTDPTPANNSATDTDTLTPQADLSVTVENTPETLTTPGNVRSLAVFTNNGPSTATGVERSLTIYLDNFVIGPTFTDSLPGPLPPGATSVIDRNQSLPATNRTGVFKVEFSASAATPDPNPSNNVASDTTVLQPPI